MRVRRGAYDLPSLLTWSAVCIARYRTSLGLTNDARSAGIVAATEVAALLTSSTNTDNRRDEDASSPDASDMRDNADHMQPRLAEWLLAIRKRSL
jgi:hypothetical protein